MDAETSGRCRSSVRAAGWQRGAGGRRDAHAAQVCAPLLIFPSKMSICADRAAPSSGSRVRSCANRISGRRRREKMTCTTRRRVLGARAFNTVHVGSFCLCGAI
uniref:Uncharacterized protein n=1 Tax=Setaria viridis TaxID=4556 RepID=A0A4U6W5L7_SETVI|nr:hypothetical protein SEVIR_1G022900v2 [Setaria viridis]